MGKVKDLVTELEQAINPTQQEIVIYQNERGWYGWAPAHFWDDPMHEHYRNQRKELGRTTDLYEALAAIHAFNQMTHGKTHETF